MTTHVAVADTTTGHIGVGGSAGGAGAGETFGHAGGEVAGWQEREGVEEVFRGFSLGVAVGMSLRRIRTSSLEE
jgi:hypothetical protein